MASKKLTKDKRCPRCGFKDETINHVSFPCPYARLVWVISLMAMLMFPYPAYSMYTNMAKCLIPARDRDE